MINNKVFDIFELGSIIKRKSGGNMEKLSFTVKEYNNAFGGTECKFIRINNRKAVKVFTNYTKTQVQNIYENQAKAYYYGIGPKVYEVACVKIGNMNYWGYITEIVKTMPKNISENNTVYVLKELTNKQCKELKNLKSKMQKLGFNKIILKDLHSANIGFRKGKMICIDFGEHDIF